jgi:hypothetical protein
MHYGLSNSAPIPASTSTPMPPALGDGLAGMLKTIARFALAAG